MMVFVARELFDKQQVVTQRALFLAEQNARESNATLSEQFARVAQKCIEVEKELLQYIPRD